jgi:hypothetical protein
MSQPLARRGFLQLLTSAGVAWVVNGEMTAIQKQTSAAEALDHLMIGAADLDRGVQWLEQRSGMRAAIGGTHPGRGTRNALIALRGRQYVELIAPDPAQPENLSAHLRSIKEPRVIGWAAASSDIESLGKRIRSMGHEPSAPRPGSRARPDGRILRWTTLGVSSKYAAGGVDPIPFFIQWGADSAHPSSDSPAGCELSSLEFEHPDSEDLSDALARLEISATVRQARSVGLVATLSTPKGAVVFR